MPGNYSSHITNDLDNLLLSFPVRQTSALTQGSCPNLPTEKGGLLQREKEKLWVFVRMEKTLHSRHQMFCNDCFIDEKLERQASSSPNNAETLSYTWRKDSLSKFLCEFIGTAQCLRLCALIVIFCANDTCVRSSPRLVNFV